MKLVVVLVLVFVTNGLRAQMDFAYSQKDSLVTVAVSHPQFSEYDKIKLESGDSLIVNIIAETQTEVAYKYPMNTMINKTLFVKIKEIDYKDGTARAIRNMVPVTGVGAEPDNLWRIVVVTFDENAVAGLKEIGPIEAKAEGKSLKTKIDLLEKNAILNLQKEAVRMNATKVLVKKKNIEQSYGEIPMVEMKGMAYGVE